MCSRANIALSDSIPLARFMSDTYARGVWAWVWVWVRVWEYVRKHGQTGTQIVVLLAPHPSPKPVRNALYASEASMQVSWCSRSSPVLGKVATHNSATAALLLCAPGQGGTVFLPLPHRDVVSDGQACKSIQFRHLCSRNSSD